MSLVPDYIKNLLPYKAGKPIDEVRRELGIENIIAKRLTNKIIIFFQVSKISM